MAFVPSALKAVTWNPVLGDSSVVRDGNVHIWTYSSTDAYATVKAANYISSAYDIGMAKGDVVWVVTTSSGTPTAVNQAVVMNVTSSGADLSDGQAVTVANT